MAKDQHQVSVKLSPELRQHLKAYKAKQDKRSLEATVVEILENHFHSICLSDQPPALESSLTRIASLEAKMTYLSEQLEALRQAIATTPSSQPASTLGLGVARQFPASAAPRQAPTSQTQPPISAVANDDDDDMYDEPDEVLYSFLEP
jgi:hypothetical protein